MDSKLSTLAVELIELVIRGLEPADLLSLRLVCRALNHKTLQCFGQTCLATLRTDLSYQSLMKVREVSEHEQLRCYVQRLLIQGGDDLGRGYTWHRDLSGRLITPQPALELLGDALLNRLVNCRSFRISPPQEPEDLDESECLRPSDAAGIILDITADTGLPIRSFHVDFRKLGTTPTAMKRLDTPRYQKPEFRAGWAHLEELILDYTMVHGYNMRAEAENWAVELILHAPSLQTLTLGADFGDDDSLVNKLSSSDTLPELQELSMRSRYPTEEILSTFILRFCNSLRTLSIWNVGLPLGGTWVSALKKWSCELPLLERISFKHLVEMGPPRRLIVFPSLRDNPEVPETGARKFDFFERKLGGELQIIGVRYQGPRMDVALEILARSAVSSI